MAGCSSKPLPEARSQARVAFQSVQDPIRELCTDDSSHRTDYFTGPLVRFEASTVVLNGAPHRAGELLGWADKKYERSVEPTLWVQVSPDSVPIAESALLQLIQALRLIFNSNKLTPALLALSSERPSNNSACWRDPSCHGIVGVIVRGERRWTSAGASCARKLVRSTGWQSKSVVSR
jgi:hypothetical protein